MIHEQLHVGMALLSYIGWKVLNGIDGKYDCANEKSKLEIIL
jgi:hypothetical protein